MGELIHETQPQAEGNKAVDGLENVAVGVVGSAFPEHGFDPDKMDEKDIESYELFYGPFYELVALKKLNKLS